MSKTTGLFLTFTGAVLIVFALLLTVNNQYEDDLAGQRSEDILTVIKSHIKPSGAEESPREPLPAELPVKELDGNEYVGYLEIPALDLKLPVMNEWDYARLKTAPCRQSGSSRTDDLVIAAHNYQSHFGRLKELTRGDTVLFTDMEGIVSRYTVERTEMLEPTALNTVLSSGCELVLYTCTPGGSERIAAFCRREAFAAVN